PSDNTMPPSQPTPTVLYADQEHSGIRLVVPLLVGAGWVLGYFLLRFLLRNTEYNLVLSCAGGLPIGLTIAALSEYVLKRTWRSGRTVALDETGITVNQPDEAPMTVEWAKRIVPTRWYFELKGFPRGGRERRAPTGWLCLACQLQQDDNRFTVFSFLPRKRAARWLENGRQFREIHPAELHESGWRERINVPSRPSLPANLLTGKDGPFWLAERRRWNEGLELTANDFETFMEHVTEYVKDG
ncbi:MAG: hypothetical protein L0332_26080, partial [Chloroflexi bacterium]|nr:hypothetical protein [Chloroflexota bacterium]MCI0730168.1 hypothetical protein [Chloroflexota bacterium]